MLKAKRDLELIISLRCLHRVECRYSLWDFYRV